MKKIIIILILCCLLLNCVCVYAAPAQGVFEDNEGKLTMGDGKGEGYIGGSTTLNKSVNAVWQFIKHLIQILALGVVIFVGIRYMMASADQKADIKKSMMWLVIGAVITFCSTTVIQYIVVVVNDFLK